jgi:tetratricopeptide (TPR) repeat protein
MARMYVGEYEAALPHLLEAAALAEKANAVGPLNAALGLRAQCLFRLDRWDAVLELEQQWRALERRYPRERLGPTCFSVALSAGIFAMRGDQQRARAYAEESYDFMVSIAGPEEGWPRNPFY